MNLRFRIDLVGSGGYDRAVAFCCRCNRFRVEHRRIRPESKEDRHLAFLLAFTERQQGGGWAGWSQTRARFLVVRDLGVLSPCCSDCATDDERWEAQHALAAARGPQGP